MLAGVADNEVVYEFTPEPASASHQALSGGSLRAKGSVPDASLDASPGDAREAFKAFSQREEKAAVAGGSSALVRARPRAEYEALGAGSAASRGGFEPPEQRLARLQAEVAELSRLAESGSSGPAAAQGADGAAADLLGGDPAAVAEELQVLSQRLGALARDGPQVWASASGSSEEVARGPMPESLATQLQRLAAAGGAAGSSAPPPGSDGRITYEISYAPNTGALADSSKIAALEGSIADIEKRLGVLGPEFPFNDLHTAITHLQKRLSLLDSGKVDAISRRLNQVQMDIDAMLSKKAELALAGGASADPDMDAKVGELYEFCHRWSATAGSLPTILSRLQSLQAVHQQSSAFASRLEALERQQDELTRLLETTNLAVVDLGKSLQENMTIVLDNVRGLEGKMKAVK